MLLPFKSRTTLVVSPERLWLHMNGDVVECALSSHSSATQMMMEITEQLMPYQRQLRSSELHVVLSNHFVRYAILPWRVGLTKGSDWQALAENHMRQIYGQKTSTWQINIALQGYGKPIVVVAVDTPIIEQFEVLAKQFHWSLRAIEPAFSTVLNHYKNQLNKNTWLLLAEPRRLLLAQAEDGVWQRFSVAMPPASEEAQAVMGMLNQARQSQPEQRDVRLFLHGNRSLFPSNLGDSFKVEQLLTKQSEKLPLHNLSYGYLT